MTRHGMATVWVLVLLTVVSLISLAVARQFVLGHQAMERQEERVQALWLARSGLESAVDRVATEGSDYAGERLTPVDDGEVIMTVEPVPGSPDRVRVTAEAKYPTTRRFPVVRKLSRELDSPAKP